MNAGCANGNRPLLKSASSLRTKTLHKIPKYPREYEDQMEWSCKRQNHLTAETNNYSFTTRTTHDSSLSRRKCTK